MLFPVFRIYKELAIKNFKAIKKLPVLKSNGQVFK
jgi:hypothetical protein